MRTYTAKKQQVEEIEDVQSVCRLCLARSGEMIPIYDGNVEDVISALSVRIGMCLGLEVSRDDALPKIICKKCNCELEKFYTFKKNCAATYRKLKASLNAVRKKSKDEVKLVPKSNEISFDSSVKSSENIDAQLDKSGTIVSELNIEKDGCQMSAASEDTTRSLATTDAEAVQGFDNNQMEENHNLDIVEEPIELRNQNTDHIKTEESLSAYIVTSLIEKGLLAKRDEKLEIIDPSVTTISLETACGSEVVMELVEEDLELQTEGCNRSTGPKIFDPNLKNNGRCCGTCGARLSSRGALARHQRVHTGERPFQCRSCPRRFAQREVLRRHELLHADKLPYQCAWCPKAYTQRGALAAHARSHAPPAARALVLHRCSRCPKVFLYPSGLSRHMSVHQGRDFPCDECARTFNDKSSLRRHRRGHQRARPR